MIKYLLLFCVLSWGARAQMAPPKYNGNEVKSDRTVAETEKSKTTPPAKSPDPKSPEPEAPKPPPPEELLPKGDAAKPSYHPGNAFDPDCKYEDVPFTDCDPFHLVKWRQQKLTFGGSHCEPYKNETKRCSPDDFPPGTKWLIDEHKKCLSELEHLKGILGDLHHWVDIIHERGQDLYNAFNELKKHLEDLQRQIKDLHKQDHSNQVIMERIQKELEEWKEKARSLRTTVDGLKAKYDQLSKEHEKMKEKYHECEAKRDGCLAEAKKLSARESSLIATNRELKGQLLEAERYQNLVEKAMARIKHLEQSIENLKKSIVDTKNAYHQCRLDILNAKNVKHPSYEKDTHVNLDMQMWITHNQTKNEYSTTTTTTTTTYKTTTYTTPYKTYKPYEVTSSHRRDVPA